MKKILGVALLATAILVIVLSSPSIFGLLVNTIIFSSIGSVKTVDVGDYVHVGAYWDSNCTSAVSTIDWGDIEPGSKKTVILYLKNEGNVPITLSLNTTNWIPPSALTYISISWDYSGNPISPGNIIQVTLFLDVSGSISDVSSFTLDIVITATG